jgi:hypothetical protein
MEREGVITGDMRGHVTGGGGTGPRRVGLYVRNQQNKYNQERPATAGQPGLDRAAGQLWQYSKGTVMISLQSDAVKI